MSEAPKDERRSQWSRRSIGGSIDVYLWNSGEITVSVGPRCFVALSPDMAQELGCVILDMVDMAAENAQGKPAPDTSWLQTPEVREDDQRRKENTERLSEREKRILQEYASVPLPDAATPLKRASRTSTQGHMENPRKEE
ncbi:MAG TPA: hypothetical protein VIY48_14270 [Candidatus Paceibacterota bacterium]